MDNTTKAIAWIGVAVVAWYFLKSAGVLSFGKAGQIVNANPTAGAVAFGPVPNTQTGANIGAAAAGIGSGLGDIISSLNSGN